MKKLFFFRSSAGNNNPITPPPSKDKQVYWEEKKKKNAADNKNQLLESNQNNFGNFTGNPSLRRSLSFSSGTARDPQNHLTRFTNQNQSPCSITSNASLKLHDRRSSRSCTPAGERQSKAKWFQDGSGQILSSSSSSNCSSSLSNKVVDRFIDGEQQQQHERRMPKINSSSHRIGVQNGVKQKPRSHSFREPQGTQHVSTRDWVDNGFGHGSPRELAKHVIERLSQSHVMPRDNSKQSDPVGPITVEDIYGDRFPSLDSNGIPHINIEDDNDKPEEDSDVELFRKSKEAEERAMFLSEELEQEIFLQDGGFSVPALIQTIRNLTEERVNMALEVSNVLQDRIAERASFKEDLRSVKAELDSQTQRLEKEKNELQSALEKEHRLRDRVRELAENNVLLQREISSFGEREMQIKDLTANVEESKDENRNLCQNLSDLRDKYRVVEEERDSIRKEFEEKQRECKELHKSIARLVRTCSEQEKTIEGLREGLSEEFRKKNFVEKFDSNQLGKLQMEQVRLTGVERGLRKDVESYRHEVDYLRQENTNLLDRLGGKGSIFKLDQELSNRIGCCQDQGISLVNDSVKLCMKLLEYIKANQTRSSETEDIEAMKNGLNGQFVIDSDMKIQGFKRRAENLARSLQKLSTVLNDMSNLHTLTQSHDQSSEEKLQAELKAESLLTTLLREKLYAKELDLEQLEAELSAAVRGNDILRSEVQHAMDTVSCITHNTKDLELEMIKKDESLKRLQNELQDCKKELSIVRGILPKVTEERDLMWEEVKQYSEKTMLLNCEVNGLKKKIEALDEDLLLKEGQITILKDSIVKPFDLLASPEFLLDC